MIQEFYPPNPSPNNTITVRQSMPFRAQSVVINSGPNFITLLPSGEVIGPGLAGAVLNTDTATAIASFTVTAPPAGIPPAGPTQQQYSYLEFTSDLLPATPGTPTSVPEQPITLIQQISITKILNPRLEEAIWAMSLNKACTFFAFARDGNVHNFVLSVTLDGGQNFTEGIASSSPTAMGSIGLGTEVEGFTLPVGSGTYAIQMSGGLITDHFVLDGRIYS